jgi:GDP-L-fucose synthase
MKNSFWKGKKVLVTGGAGFLGGHLVTKLKTYEANVFVPSSKTYDLRLKENCKKVVQNQDIVIHLAAKVGGIGFNKKHPGEMFYDNMLMGVHLIEEARLAKVKKFVAIGTICAYPKYTPVPFDEKDLWNGYPEETNAPYGLAKKMLLVQAQAYRQQYGFNIIYLLPVNMYGPGDKYDPSVSHVIPALIKKAVEAKKYNKKELVVWGTGKPTREFLYVEDAVEAILLATEKYNGSDPVNIGSGTEISIKELIKLICKLVGYKGKIVWDKTKPDGQPRRKLDSSKAFKEFGFKAKADFIQSLKETIDSYLVVSK